MKPKHISDAIGKLDENMIAEAQSARVKKRKPRWIAWVAAAACVAVMVALARPMLQKDAPANEQATEQTQVLGRPSQTVLHDADFSIFKAAYPLMEKYPDFMDYQDDMDAYYDAYNRWHETKAAIRDSVDAVADENYFDDFYQTSALEFLSQAGDENLIYSPSNVYMALAMLAELTDGESRQQILDLLRVGSVEELRTEARYLWSTNYCDDGLLTTVMANSLWLDDDLPYNQETMNLIGEKYYASSFSGQMGTAEYNAALHSWLNEQTGDLLSEQVEGLEFDPSTVLALASTIYFNGQWSESFSSYYTEEDTFHGTSGDSTVDFMNSSDIGTVYWGENYRAIEKHMEGNASMWLILPDEDKTIADVLKDGEMFDMTSAGARWDNCKSVTVNLSMPKFDVTSKIDLIDGLQALGVHDVFDPVISDFTPMSSDLESVYVSEAEHAARVMVDEKGCTAAAYTVMMTECGAAICEDEIDFVLDRPFIFVITGCGDQPLFIGVVNQVS